MKSLTIQSRSYFSIEYLEGAKLLADEAKCIEDEFNGQYWYDKRHKATVHSSILMASAFLESLINELFTDAADNHQRKGAIISTQESKILGEMWKLGVPRTAKYTILDKYRICLTLLQRPPLDLSTQPQQHIRLLIKLRNALTHFEPSTVEADATLESGIKGHELDSLRGLFPENRLMAPGNAFFPDKCLGAGCAAWAVNVTVGFAEEFKRRLSSPPIPHEV